MRRRVRIGTRGSLLARTQAEGIAAQIRRLSPTLTVEVIPITTRGDTTPLPTRPAGGKGLFVKEIEEALLTGQIDLAIHSAKDLPAALPSGLTLAAVPEREDPRDVLIAQEGRTLRELPPGARVGTSSIRRRAQLLHARPDLRIIPLRGNVETRIRTLESEPLDAIVLAAAGLRRLNLLTRVTEYLDEEVCLPAIGQGALGLEIRTGDLEIATLLDPLDHPPSRRALAAERAFLSHLGGDCQTPLAASGRLQDRELILTGLVASPDGKILLRETVRGRPDEADRLGGLLAEALRRQGADEILRGAAEVSPREKT